MKHDEFKIGEDFRCAGRTYRCTDIGTRTVVGIRIDRVSVTTMVGERISNKSLSYDQALSEGWFNGPPYAVEERVFDEDSQKAFSSVKGGDAPLEPDPDDLLPGPR